jgi:hypothetical protein
MFGQITDLPSLRTYEEAVAHYESIVPIRGNADNVRPICATTNGRRKKHMAIRKYVDGSVACRLYDTDVVTFETDGDVIFRNGGWPTATTHGFANGILRDGVIYFGTRQNRTEITVGGNAHIMDGNDFFRLRKDNEGRYVAVNPPAQYEYYARRKVLTAKRNPVLAFQKHCLAMAKLADPEQQKGDSQFALYCRRTDRAYNIMSDPTMKDWGELVQGILACARISSYIYGHGRQYRFRDTLIKEFISDVIKHRFADEIFEKQEVSRKTFNGNEKYFD